MYRKYKKRFHLAAGAGGSVGVPTIIESNLVMNISTVGIHYYHSPCNGIISNNTVLHTGSSGILVDLRWSIRYALPNPFYLSLFISGTRAPGQEQFVRSLQENEHLWHPNVKEIVCETQFNKQPHDPDAAVFVKCSIFWPTNLPTSEQRSAFAQTSKPATQQPGNSRTSLSES
jgi:hypothetical protein